MEPKETWLTTSHLLGTEVIMHFLPSKLRSLQIEISSFFSFFPNVLQPPMAVAGNTLHNFLVRIGACKKVVRRFDMSNASPGFIISLPGIDPQDSERRRFVNYEISH